MSIEAEEASTGGRESARASLLEQAIALALRAHLGQADIGGHPYILHPLRLMLQMETDEQRIAAVLHDVVEDGGATLDGVAAMGFPASVVEALECLTRRKNEDYEEYIQRIRGNPLARRVKLADLEDNMNLARLSEVGNRDLERVEKYHKALAFLRKQAGDGNDE